MTDLEKKVIRCYVKKEMSLATMANMGICNAEKAREILKKYNLLKIPGQHDKIKLDSPPQ